MTVFNPKTPWTQALELPRSDEALEAKLRVRPLPHPELKDYGPTRAGELLDASLELLFHPSKQHLRIIRTLADIGWSHAAASYLSVDDFMRNAQVKPEVTGPVRRHRRNVRMRMLTGPAGVGKSSLIAAMERVFVSEATVRASAGLPAFPIRPVAMFSVGEDRKSASRLNAIAESVGLEPMYRRGDAADMAQLALRLYHRGCSLLIADEVQFLTRTETNAQVTSILLQLGLLRLPTVYVANYDLGHKLKRRPPHDTARLLSKPIIMLPDAYDDPAFLGQLQDIATTLPGVVQIDLEKEVKAIHGWTFGLGRCVRNLFVVAYVLMRQQHRRSTESMRLTMQHLEDAYNHIDYEESKKGVIASRDTLQDIGSPDSDFRCPFELPQEQQVQQRAEARRLRQEQLDREREKDARTGEERKRQEQAARERAATQPKPAVRRVPAGPARPATADEWLQQLGAKRGRTK